MADNFYGFDDAGDEEKGRDNLFLWTVFILVLIGVAAGAWIGSFYVFGHPEDPRFYPLLRKLKKLEAPKRFEVTQGPPGEFLSAQRLFEKYGKYKDLQLEEENAALLRNYLKNYRETKKLTAYVTGRFSIVETYALKKTDMFPSGVVAVAQSIDFPQVLIEHLYPADQENVGTLRAMLQTGLDMKIERTNDLSAIIHIERVQDGRLQFTLVPLLYGTYALKQGVGTFGLVPPDNLNMAGGLPITKPAALKQALAAYADFRKSRPAAESTEQATPPPGPELVRVETVEPGGKVPESGAMPAMAVATPIPIPGQATPRPIAAAQTPPPRLAMLNTPAPRLGVPQALGITPIPIAAPIPAVKPPAAMPAPSQTSPTGVPLKPFIAAAPAPGTMPSVPGATWRTYPAGRMPSARSITPLEAGDLAGRGDLGEKLYLQGNFRVTASGENRAVLRDRAAGTGAANPADSIRIIVEYPAGAVPPDENAVLSRDPSRPFEVRDIRRGADGQVNIYVREIIAP